MMRYNMIILLAFLHDGVFSADTDEVNMSVMEGGSVPLNTGVTKQQHETMRWYFNDILIVQINGDPKKNCLYDGEDGRFRDIVEVDYKTGSLNITNIRSEHAGRYEAEHIRSESSGIKLSLNRNSTCDRTKISRKTSNMDDTIKIFSVTVSGAADPGKADSQKDIKETETDKIPASGLSAGAVAGIVVAVLVSVTVGAAGGIYYRHRRTGKDGEMRKQEVL
ncbi:hypothetical protein R3I93_016880 [Phoxinus phoxinus]|uniref:Uncharacterized protein n=1 Tax=Phoxinus phoxinus TaxID=58324 RepID=A0AAN9CGN3_9TELE